jgi:hypothetical protein
MSGAHPSGHIFPSGLLDLSALCVEVIKKVSETGGLEACNIKVFPLAFWPLKKGILSDRQDS